MTAVISVSQKQMKQRTGFGKALGYALPKEDKILIRKDLPKDLRKEVLAHEEDHIAKGEEGPFLAGLIGAVAAPVIGGLFASRSAKKAANAQVDAANREIEFARESRDIARADYAPYRRAGNTALGALMDMVGLGGSFQAAGGTSADNGIRNIPNGNAPAAWRPTGGRGSRRSQYQLRVGGGPTHEDQDYIINELGPEDVYSGGRVTRGRQPSTIDGRTGYVQPNRALYAGGFMDKMTPQFGEQVHTNAPTPQTVTNQNPTQRDATGRPVENPGGREGGYSFQTDPGYNFRFDEGQRFLERGAAARGGLLSGGYARKAIRYGQDYASQEYTNIFNRLSSIAGLGRVGVQGSANAALRGGSQMGAAIAGAGNARATGYINQGNVWSGVINDVARLPWGGS